MVQLPTWSLPLIVAAIVVPIVGGFLIAGPPLGLAVGAVAAASVLVIAARQRPDDPITGASPSDHQSHVLVALSRPLESAGAVEAISEAARSGTGEGPGEILVLAPATSSFLDRVATDVRKAHSEAQRKLVLSVASLARADLDARAQVGDQDLVQAVEDTLRTYPATKVVIATGPAGEDRDGARAVAELKSRLHLPLQHLTLD